MTMDPQESADLPFRAVIRSGDGEPSDTEAMAEDLSTEENFDVSQDELEAAYLRAMEITEAAEAVVGESLVPSEITDEDDPLPTGIAEAFIPSDLPRTTLDDEAVDEVEDAAVSEAARPALTSRQVLEALLFVGGSALTTKRLVEILGDGFTTEQVEGLVEELNAQYAAENRPYSIQWGDSGYQFQLRPEFEKVRHRVYGLGPKEVKLSQEALEVLAFVAYQQPVRKADLEATERKNILGIVRQLIRRELVELRRSDAAPDDPTYHTTSRFLELFSLQSLDDLPFPADFAFK